MMESLEAKEACVTTNKSLFSETVAMPLLVIWSDIHKYCAAISKPAEHEFGTYMVISREFTTLEFIRTIDKVKRRIKDIFRRSMIIDKDNATGGYQDTFRN